MGAKSAVYVHDIFNILALTAIIAVDIIYLFYVTDLQRLSTSSLGAEHVPLFLSFFYAFGVYLCVDTVWICVVPACTVASSLPIIIHHILTFLFTLIPYFHPQFGWHMAVVLLVEINTLFLTLKRNMEKDSFFFRGFNILFYFTWILMRLVCFPLLTFFFIAEYMRFSKEIGTWWNIVLLAPVFQILITGLSFKWTLDMVKKKKTTESKRN